VANLHSAPCYECRNCKAGNSPRCSAPESIYGILNDGGYADFVRCSSNSLVIVPEVHFPLALLISLLNILQGVSLIHASFLNCTAAVAYRALKKLNCKRGDRVLITGSTGGKQFLISSTKQEEQVT